MLLMVAGLRPMSSDVESMIFLYGRLPVIASCVNVFFNLFVDLFAVYVVFGSNNRIREMKAPMRLTRNLWLVAVVSDLLVIVSLLIPVVTHPQVSSEAANQIAMNGLVAFTFGMLFFAFVDSLDAVVQAGGTGSEGKTASEINDEKMGGEPVTAKFVEDEKTPLDTVLVVSEESGWLKGIIFTVNGSRDGWLRSGEGWLPPAYIQRIPADVMEPTRQNTEDCFDTSTSFSTRDTSSTQVDALQQNDPWAAQAAVARSSWQTQLPGSSPTQTPPSSEPSVGVVYDDAWNYLGVLVSVPDPPGQDIAVTVEALLNDLLASSRQDRSSINAHSVKTCWKELRRLAKNENHYEKPAPVTCAGDPMIIDSTGRTHHYWGSALMVNFNRFGVVTALEYVGATPDRNFISEVWRHDVPTNKYKYCELPPTEADRCTGEWWRDGPKYSVGDGSWSSEAPDGAVPPQQFLSKFKPANRTFFINTTTGTFMQGPDLGTLRRLLNDKDKMKCLTNHVLEAIGDLPQEWMKSAVGTIAENSGYHYSDHGRYHKSDCPRTEGLVVEKIHKIQLAQFALGFAVSTIIHEAMSQSWES